MTLQEEIRKAARELRTRSFAISDLMPTLLKAADKLDATERLLERWMADPETYIPEWTQLRQDTADALKR